MNTASTSTYDPTESTSTIASIFTTAAAASGHAPTSLEEFMSRGEYSTHTIIDEGSVTFVTIVSSSGTPSVLYNRMVYPGVDRSVLAQGVLCVRFDRPVEKLECDMAVRLDAKLTREANKAIEKLKADGSEPER